MIEIQCRLINIGSSSLILVFKRGALFFAADFRADLRPECWPNEVTEFGQRNVEDEPPTGACQC